MKEFRVLVCGGRDYQDRAYVFRVLDEIHAETPISIVSHGACGWDADAPEYVFNDKLLRGADRWAHEWGATRCVPVFTMAAHWSTRGRAAGPIRNGLLVAHGHDLAVAFSGGPGTADMVRRCEQWGIKVRDER